ncbi:MAG: glutamine--tRNA ligase/YqeY domain fusion protein [Verrucomicrobiaceae bacterium]|nr:glutamine--tRNA ligase/YqeY domain fusion protein [Verrucomicrobiaceae bacterium]NCF92820.1 glutamine--tRNA ligase/YqeY domain fusion protein [Verrucomicrobiaceae bacterium]
MSEETEDEVKKDFIREIIDADLASGKHSEIVTRFPPEPNGYLHIGHAKSICLNFGLSKEYSPARCHLRFDDTNPSKEETEYVESIQEDVRWLGFDWGKNLFFASDYFDQLHGFAVQLIESGHAYVDSLSAEEIRTYRGTLTEPGKPSPHRDRSVEENLDLFARMAKGEFAEGEHVLRAKIDMASPNMNMRDPTLYRIRKESHHRTGNKWCVYPMYDFTHGLSDMLEGVTHSLCTLEFEHHRPLYEWFLKVLKTPCQPRQIEFARLGLTYTVMSKRFLLKLVESGKVNGWDDPRMPTISGIRRRGYTAEAIRRFCHRIGLTKYPGMTDISLLEFSVREHLNEVAPRVMGVLKPLKVVITNYPEDGEEMVDAVNHPGDPEAGKRPVPFSRELYIEQNDFMEDPPRKFFRLGPGREVRFRYAYYVTCQEVIKDDHGTVTELRCTYDPESRGGKSADGRKVKGTIHWVSAKHAVPATVRLIDRLFTVEDPHAADGELEDQLNPDAIEELMDCQLEPSLRGQKVGYQCQFERLGYFCIDPDTTEDGLVINRTIGLRDSWAKQAGKR